MLAEGKIHMGVDSHGATVLVAEASMALDLEKQRATSVGEVQRLWGFAGLVMDQLSTRTTTVVAWWRVESHNMLG